MGAGAETANLTLLVDGEEPKEEEVNKEEEGAIVLTLDWNAKNLNVGQGIVVTCSGQAGLVFSSTLSSCPSDCRKEGWVSASSVSELIHVGGLPDPTEIKKYLGSPEKIEFPEGKPQP